MVRFDVAGANTQNCPGFSSILLLKTSTLVFIKPGRKGKVQRFCAINSVHTETSSSSASAQSCQLSLFAAALRLALLRCAHVCSEAARPQAALGPSSCHRERTQEHMAQGVLDTERGWKEREREGKGETEKRFC